MPHIVSIFAVYIAIFLFGMIVLRIGLGCISKNTLQSLLMTLTKSPMRGLLIGVIAAGVLQSSSAVLVLTVGLVASGYLSFKQSLGIILGVNIGTTFTLEIMTLDFGFFIPFMLIGGTILLAFKKPIPFGIGGLLFGFGCIFVAMRGFVSMAEPLATLSVVRHIIEQSDQNLLLGVGIGTIITAIIQSSSATAGIVMGFMSHKVITLSAGIAIVLGANIGTCVTALLASFGAKVEAKLVAYAHIWLNVFGVILFIPFIQSLAMLVGQLTQLPDVQIAHASLIFNTIVSFLALPFVSWMARFLLKMHGTNTA